MRKVWRRNRNSLTYVLIAQALLRFSAAILLVTLPEILLCA